MADANGIALPFQLICQMPEPGKLTSGVPIQRFKCIGKVREDPLKGKSRKPIHCPYLCRVIPPDAKPPHAGIDGNMDPDGIPIGRYRIALGVLEAGYRQDDVAFQQFFQHSAIHHRTQQKDLLTEPHFTQGQRLLRAGYAEHGDTGCLPCSGRFIEGHAVAVAFDHANDGHLHRFTDSGGISPQG